MKSPRLRRLRPRAGVRVYLVDGEEIRDRHVDFTMGGSGARYSFIPRNEIWIESTLSPRDREATILHELAERDLMLFHRHGYERAHDKANVVERRWRRKHRRRQVRRRRRD